MASSTTIQWVVFDLGGVVLTETTALPQLAEQLGISPHDPNAMARFTRAYHASRLEYDRVSDARAYWTQVARDCDVMRPGPRAVSVLTAMDNAGWAHANPETVKLITDLDHTGIRLAVLSNMSSSMGVIVRDEPWAKPFQHFVISGDLGVVKPDPAIYAHLLRTLNTPAAEVVFLDDLAKNIAAAEGCGLNGVEFTDPQHARDQLRRLGITV